MAEILIGSFAFRGGLIDKIKPLLEGLVDKGVDIESIGGGVFNPSLCPCLTDPAKGRCRS